MSSPSRVFTGLENCATPLWLSSGKGPPDWFAYNVFMCCSIMRFIGKTGIFREARRQQHLCSCQVSRICQRRRSKPSGSLMRYQALSAKLPRLPSVGAESSAVLFDDNDDMESSRNLASVYETDNAEEGYDFSNVVVVWTLFWRSIHVEQVRGAAVARRTREANRQTGEGSTYENEPCLNLLFCNPPYLSTRSFPASTTRRQYIL
jgi:hypothetical protein